MPQRITAGFAGMTRLTRLYTKVAVVFLNTVLLVALMELGAGAVLSIVGRHIVSDAFNNTVQSPYFSGREWAQDYWREFFIAANRFQYHPYSMWRMAPFAEGRLIRVNSEGLRVTPGASCRARTGQNHRVWVFGGSTVWGIGSPDDGTIPAHLQVLLARARSKPVCVVNFGQLAFTSTQGVVQLANELRGGLRPDAVVFYDGVNDIMTAFSYNRPGLHMAFPAIARKLQAQTMLAMVSAPSPTLRDIAAWSNQYQLLKRLVSGGDSLPSYRYEGYSGSEELAEATVSAYLENVSTVNALAGSYGFRVAFFWQPNVLVGAKPLAEPERNMKVDEHFTSFTRKVYGRLRDRAPGVANLHDLAGVFDQDPSLAYLDWHHTTPEANGKIAQAIAAAISR